jgi:hypothetical protein
MKQTRGLIFVTVALACIALVAPAFAQSGGDQPPPAGQGGDKTVAADPISGEWEGLVDMPDGPLPFGMTLKLDQGKVTGDISSSAGTVAISAGSWVDGKLTVAFTYVDGAGIEMVGALADGQFSGSLSYGGGQMVMNWVANKKPAK